MDLTAYLLAAFATVLTGISKSGFAGGLGILGVPLLALAMPAQAAVVLLLPILLGIDLLSVWRYRRAGRSRVILALLPGAAVGIGIGFASLSYVDDGALRLGIGMMALGFVARFLWSGGTRDGAVSRAPWPLVFGASALSGFAGCIAHAGGPPIKGTFLRMGLDKAAFVGTNAVFFLMLNLFKAVGYGALGLFSADSLMASASLLPFLGIGVAVGFAMHDRVPQVLFGKIAYGLLALAGVNLVYLGLTG